MVLMYVEGGHHVTRAIVLLSHIDTLTLLSSFASPAAMSRINVPPAMMAEIKEAMTSTSEEILRSRLDDSQVVSELPTNLQYAVGGIA